jgi:hypothetical protein
MTVLNLFSSDLMIIDDNLRLFHFFKQAHLFVPRPKWFRSDDVNVGDVVLFFVEQELKSSRWHYALVKEVKGRRLILEYTNPPSDSKKLIEKSKRDMV